MKFLVVGTGSIGRRHITNLLHLGQDVLAYSVRGNPSGIVDGVSILEVWPETLPLDVDAVIVANSTEQHIMVALQAARQGKALYIEKPLSTSLVGIEELAHINKSKGLVVESGFMLRSHPNLVWIKKYITDGMLGELMHFRASVGQWLPDWRPGTDHRTGYGAFREKGGGVIFDLIHELDLVRWLGGQVIDVIAMTRCVNQLEIETEAIAQVGLRLDSGALAQVHLDYVRPGYGRALEIVGSQGVLSWDYTKGTVLLESSDGSEHVVHSLPESFDRNAMFLRYMRHFLNRIAAPSIPALSSLQDGIDALRIALACHYAASERRSIHPDELPENFEVKERC